MIVFSCHSWKSLISYILDPISYILDPVSYILDPISYTLDPISYILDPICYWNSHSFGTMYHPRPNTKNQTPNSDAAKYVTGTKMYLAPFVCASS